MVGMVTGRRLMGNGEERFCLGGICTELVVVHPKRGELFCLGRLPEGPL